MTKTMSFGASIEYRKTLPHPERTAMCSVSRSSNGGMPCWDVQFKDWTNRDTMARAIRKQQQRERRNGDWTAMVPLTDGEGY